MTTKMTLQHHKLEFKLLIWLLRTCKLKIYTFYCWLQLTELCSSSSILQSILIIILLSFKRVHETDGKSKSRILRMLLIGVLFGLKISGTPLNISKHIKVDENNKRK